MNTKDIFNSLKVISGVIYKYYRELCNLEYNNKKDSVEYNNILKKINKLEKIEDSLIETVEKSGNDNIVNLCAYAQLDMVGKKRIDRIIQDPFYILSNKIKEKDIIDMRISRKATEKYVKYASDIDDKIFSIYEPIKNLDFITMMSNEMKTSDNKAYNDILLDAMYDYMYINNINSIKDISKLTDEELSEYKGLMNAELHKYAVKFSKLSKKTLCDKSNSRRLALDVNYIRACLKNFTYDDINNFKLYMVILISSELGEKDGIEVFNNILDESLEEKNEYGEYEL